jgi:DNA repair protein RadC
MPKVKSNDAPQYRARAMDDDQIISQALEILRKRAKRGAILSGPQDVRDLLIIETAGDRVERFGMVLLTTPHAVIGIETISTGTLNSATVHPREVVRKALEMDAAAVILFHNHPSGDPEPSAADRTLTDTLVSALRTVDVRVLDHLVVGGGSSVSFSERGLI